MIKENAYDDSQEPRLAPVVPRVRLTSDGAVLPLERHVRAIYESGLYRRINLIGPTGSGKTTALRHLAACLPPTLETELQDEWIDVGDHLSVFTSERPVETPDCIVLEMAPWTQDDVIEYCAAVHRDRCTSILRRALRPQQSVAALAGLPELWRAALDSLAKDEELEDVNAALSRALETAIPEPAQVALAGDGCLVAIQPQYRIEVPSTECFRQLSLPARRMLRHQPFRELLAADRLAGLLIQKRGFAAMVHHFPRPVIEQTARRVRKSPSAIEHLREMADGKNKKRHSMSASLLHLSENDWRPSGRRPPNLRGAYLAGVRWPEVILSAAEIQSADFRKANLSGADCSKMFAASVRLSDADLRGTLLGRAHLDNADLSRSNLELIDAVDCALSGAKLVRARMNGANLEGATFEKADLTDASLVGANLRRATFAETSVDGANFSGATLAKATLERVTLRIACFDGAVFHGTRFIACDLSGMHLPSAHFRSARMGQSDLTATTMPGSNWRDADLSGCGLAEVEWENSDLRGADFSDASFHMGSTRSGLVGSVIASEGTRTGFYTDDYFDQDYKPPEEIRKANLCGCDLREAKVLYTDWYLVDLRRAKYTAVQADYFARCGAILHDRAGS